jgi:hypothetical protein
MTPPQSNVPAILAIRSPSDAMLDAVFPTLRRRLPGRQGAVAVVGVERFQPAEVVAFLVR